MTLLGSQQTALGSVPTAAEGVPGGGGPATGDPIVVGKFSGTLVQEPTGTSETYLSDVGELAPTPFINDGVPQNYPTSARTIEGLRVTSKSGTGSKALVVTLYKNAAPTAMTVTVPASSAPGQQEADFAHAVTFADGDTYDLHASMTSGVGDGPYFLSATLEGPPGSGGGGGGGDVDSAVSGLTFPVVAGTPTLTATGPVTLPGLELTHDLVVSGAATLHGTLEVDGTATMNGALVANNGIAVQGGALMLGGLEIVTGAAVFDAGVPMTVHDTLEVDGAVTLNAGGTVDGHPIIETVTGAIAGIVDLTDPRNPVVQLATPSNAGAIPAAQEGKLEAIASPGWFDAQAKFMQLIDPALSGFEYIKLNLNPNGLTQTGPPVVVQRGPNITPALVPGGAYSNNTSWALWADHIIARPLSDHWAIGGRAMLALPTVGQAAFIGLTNDGHTVTYTFNTQFSVSTTKVILSVPPGGANDHVSTFTADAQFHDWIIAHLPGAPGSITLYVDGVPVVAVSDAAMSDADPMSLGSFASAAIANVCQKFIYGYVQV